MKIARVSAIPLNVPVEISLFGLNKTTSLSVCLSEVETNDGIVGHGLTGITEEEVIATIIREIAGPALIGEDPLNTERAWQKLYWLLSPRGQGGYAFHAIAALDVALWDIKGKALSQPVWKLLGGARERLLLYATFGFSFFDRDLLREAAKHWVAQGYGHLKMVVGQDAIRRRDEPRPVDEVVREDAARVRAVRDAVGPEIKLAIDANCNLDFEHALRLAHEVEDCDIAFFEEPITQNDIRLMMEMRRHTSIPLSAGQNESLSHRFRDMLIHDAVDIVQPNVVITGGFTQCVRIAGLTAAFNKPIANGGAWMYHNMHLQAGVSNGTLAEDHYVASEVCRRIYPDLPVPKEGWIELPGTPGLGFAPDSAAVRELAKLPGARGRGKG
jgi:L-rhamnonate dehydratase